MSEAENLEVITNNNSAVNKKDKKMTFLHKINDLVPTIEIIDCAFVFNKYERNGRITSKFMEPARELLKAKRKLINQSTKPIKTKVKSTPPKERNSIAVIKKKSPETPSQKEPSTSTNGNDYIDYRALIRRRMGLPEKDTPLEPGEDDWKALRPTNEQFKGLYERLCKEVFNKKRRVSESEGDNEEGRRARKPSPSGSSVSTVKLGLSPNERDEDDNVFNISETKNSETVPSPNSPMDIDKEDDKDKPKPKVKTTSILTSINEIVAFVRLVDCRSILKEATANISCKAFKRKLQRLEKKSQAQSE